MSVEQYMLTSLRKGGIHDLKFLPQKHILGEICIAWLQTAHMVTVMPVGKAI